MGSTEDTRARIQRIYIHRRLKEKLESKALLRPWYKLGSIQRIVGIHIKRNMRIMDSPRKIPLVQVEALPINYSFVEKDASTTACIWRSRGSLSLP